MAIWSAEAKEIEKLYRTVNDNLPILGKEIEATIKSNDANVVLLYARRCLEVIVTELCETELNRPRKTEPLNQRQSRSGEHLLHQRGYGRDTKQPSEDKGSEGHLPHIGRTIQRS